MDNDNRTDKRDELEASKHIIEYVHAMRDFAVDNDMATLGESTFAHAEQSLCLWPFCT